MSQRNENERKRLQPAHRLDSRRVSQLNESLVGCGIDLSITHDGDLYVATLLESRWIIIRYPASPLFAPAPVEITKLPQQLYDEFSAYFLRRSKSLPNGESEI